MFGTQQSELFTDDSWRNASITNLQTEDGMSPSYDNRAGNDPTDDEMNSFSSMAAPSNISTFDNMTQTRKMFDLEDVPELADPRSDGNAARARYNRSNPRATQPNTTRRRQKAQDSTASAPRSFLEVTSKLMEFCKTFASLKLPQGFGR